MQLHRRFSFLYLQFIAYICASLADGDRLHEGSRYLRCATPFWPFGIFEGVMLCIQHKYVDVHVGGVSVLNMTCVTFHARNNYRASSEGFHGRVH
jgi:hypothetical protein